MTVTQSGSTILTRWYAGSSYIKDIVAGVSKEITYIGGDAYTAPVAAVTLASGTIYYYLLRDHLGSITHVVRSTDNTYSEYSYDAWGRRRNPTDWSYNLTGQPGVFADRGFTGHEFLPWFNLVNMNGRLYDPLVGRFLNVDPYVQMPDNSQNFNRYSYCLNNPLRYNDPDGEFFWFPVIFGAVMGAWMNGSQAVANGGNFLDGAWKGALVGAVGGALSNFGGGTFLNNVLWGTGEGAVTGGLGAGLNHGNIGNGMLWGAAGGAAFASITSGVEAYGNYENGYGFRTNEGVINNYLKSNQYQGAIDFVQTKYGMTLDFRGNNVSMKYNVNEPDYGVTDPVTGNVKIGPAAMKSSSELKATIVHEYGHSVRDRILDANGKFIGWQYPVGQFNSSNATLMKDGPIGYANEIYNAGKLNIKAQYLSPNYNPLGSEWNKGFKWLYVAPQRYTSPVNLLYY